jgi:hypothetical protein
MLRRGRRRMTMMRRRKKREKERPCKGNIECIGRGMARVDCDRQRRLMQLGCARRHHRVLGDRDKKMDQEG